MKKNIVKKEGIKLTINNEKAKLYNPYNLMELKLNRTGILIWKMLDIYNTKEKIVKKIITLYRIVNEGKIQEVKKDIKLVIKKFINYGFCYYEN